MFYSFLLSVFLLCFAGCNHPASEKQTLSVDVQPKPIVTFVPLANHTPGQYSWDLATELTEAISGRLQQRDKLYLTNREKVRALVKKLNDTQNPFGPDLSWIKNTFKDSEFVVFGEILEHEEVPLTTSSLPEELAAQLNVSVQLRILDIRKETPRIVSEELVHNSYFVPKAFSQFDFFQVSWGDASYPISPLGLAHAELAKEISTRIEDHIQEEIPLPSSGVSK